MEKLLSIREVSLILGYSVATIRNLVKNNKIQCFGGNNKNIKFNESQLRNYLNSIESSGE